MGPHSADDVLESRKCLRPNSTARAAHDWVGSEPAERGPRDTRLRSARSPEKVLHVERSRRRGDDGQGCCLRHGRRYQAACCKARVPGPDLVLLLAGLPAAIRGRSGALCRSTSGPARRHPSVDGATIRRWTMCALARQVPDWSLQVIAREEGWLERERVDESFVQ
jgi:hypothetical protein